MVLALTLVFDLGWLFFAAWATVIAALGVVAFGRDILAITHRGNGESDRNLS